MSNHLSQEQFEICAFGRSGPSELEHLAGCPQCREEVERFTQGLALFRRVVRELADDSSTVRNVDFRALPAASITIPGWSWRLAAAAALVAAIVIPFFISSPEPAAPVQQEMSADAVMERMNRHLSGIVPEPMQPMLSLISGEQPGGEGDRPQ